MVISLPRLQQNYKALLIPTRKGARPVKEEKRREKKHPYLNWSEKNIPHAEHTWLYTYLPRFTTLRYHLKVLALTLLIRVSGRQNQWPLTRQAAIESFITYRIRDFIEMRNLSHTGVSNLIVTLFGLKPFPSRRFAVRSVLLLLGFLACLIHSSSRAPKYWSASARRSLAYDYSISDAHYNC